MLGALLDDEWNLRPSTTDEYFIDRNPSCFVALLDLLRTGELHLPSTIPENLLFREALFYGLLDHVRAARWGAFDGNRLHLATSVVGQAPDDCTIGPDDGCCVAHDNLVHVYEWMLHHHRPISLDYQQVNDVGYLDARRIIVTTCENPDRGDGGMAVFRASTTELRHRFRVSHDNLFKSFTVGALIISILEARIFASSKGQCNEYGIGVWDQVIGKQTDFFYEKISV